MEILGFQARKIDFICISKHYIKNCPTGKEALKLDLSSTKIIYTQSIVTLLIPTPHQQARHLILRVCTLRAAHY